MSARQTIARAVGFLSSRKSDFRMCFDTPAGQRVLADLAVFCRAAEPCGVPGDRDRTFSLIGRNEVWLRIQQHLNLAPEHLYKLYETRAATAVQISEADDE